MSRKPRKFKGFFPPKSGGLQKKKRSSPILRLNFRPKSQIQSSFSPKIRWSQKKRSSPILRLIVWPDSKIQTFEGGCFPMGVGAIFHFSQKIDLETTKKVRFCILHKPMGEGGARAPPGYATDCRKCIPKQQLRPVQNHNLIFYFL